MTARISLTLGKTRDHGPRLQFWGIFILKSRSLPLLVLLFAGSGCAALICELVWFQFLQLIVGSSAVSLAMLLAAYMGGMCLGSLALPRMSSPYHPLRLYASVEIRVP